MDQRIENLKSKIKEMFESPFSDNPWVDFAYNSFSNSADYFLSDEGFMELSANQKTLISMISEDLYQKYCKEKYNDNESK